MPTGAFNICCPRGAVSRTANVERTGRHKWVILFQGLPDRRMLAVPQSNSCCLEIDHFRETATGSVTFTEIVEKKTYFFEKSSDTIRIRMHRLIFVYQCWKCVA